MRWMQRLKRAFRIDIETCQRCGGTLRVIASIEDPAVIALILEHLEGRNSTEAPNPPGVANIVIRVGQHLAALLPFEDLILLNTPALRGRDPAGRKVCQR